MTLLIEMEQAIRCPKCNSTQITAQKRGFSGGKAAAGAILTGGVGLLAGLHGSDNIDIHCLNCGNVWNQAKRVESDKMKAAVERDKVANVWKNALMQAYESGDREAATEIARLQRGSMLESEGLDFVYKQLKSEKTTNTVLQVIIWLIFAALVFWVISCLNK